MAMSMEQVHRIKELQVQQKGPYQIAKELGVDPKTVRKYIVPLRLVIDNATGAGRRIGEVVRLTQLFKRFQAHFKVELTFCNPASGHEKGNVENKVGYARRNYFVPIPSTPSLQAWNTELLELCKIDNAREHYKKETPICNLFEADRRALRTWPHQPFEACRYEQVKTNGYGKFVLDGRHTYSSSPMYSEREIVVLDEMVSPHLYIAP
jgi:hypothetical protein